MNLGSDSCDIDHVDVWEINVSDAKIQHVTLSTVMVFNWFNEPPTPEKEGFTTRLSLGKNLKAAAKLRRCETTIHHSTTSITHEPVQRCDRTHTTPNNS